MFDVTPTTAPVPEAVPKRGPGRPKGLGRVPGSGRRKGTPNRTHAETRERIMKEADPIGFMCRIVRGLQFEVAPDPESSAKVKRRPTLEQRLSAAAILARKCVPDMRAMEHSGPDGVPLPTDLSNLELARRLEFITRKLADAA